MSIYRVFYAESIPHGLEAVRRDRGSVMMEKHVLTFKKIQNISKNGNEIWLDSSNMDQNLSRGRSGPPQEF